MGKVWQKHGFSIVREVLTRIEQVSRLIVAREFDKDGVKISRAIENFNNRRAPWITLLEESFGGGVVLMIQQIAGLNWSHRTIFSINRCHQGIITRRTQSGKHHAAVCAKRLLEPERQFGYVFSTFAMPAKSSIQRRFHT